MGKLSTSYENSKHALAVVQDNLNQNAAQVSSITKKLRDAVIIAPVTGTVTTKYFNEGEVVPSMGSIVEMLDTRILDVKIYVSVDLLGKFKIGNDISVQAEGIDTTYKGKIIWVSPQSEFTPKNILTPETRSSLVYAVKIRLANPNGKLKQGMPVEAKIPVME